MPLSFVAMPVMLRGTPWKPLTGSSGFDCPMSLLSTFTMYGERPVCSADRVGEQNLCA
jgi:hypothetical protein